MNAAELQHELRALFERHEVELDADEDWLLTEGDFPAVRAAWQEGAGGRPGRLDIDVVLGEERQVELSYAGHGTGRAGFRDALARFARSDLHVLLAACWYLTDDRRLALASWDIGLNTWDVFLGRFEADVDGIAAPAGWVEAIRPAVERSAPTAGLHWARLFVRREADGALALECLLDNQPWADGDRAMAELAWPASPVPYGAQALVMWDVRDY